MNLAISTSIVTLLVLSACAPKSTEEVDSSKDVSLEAPTKPAVETVNGVTTVRIEGNDRMQYTLTEFSVKSGDTVRIIFENTGQSAKAVMGHNVVVLKQAVNANAYASKAALARDADFIPSSEAESVIAYTKLLGPDESDTIEFVAPEPGEYVYLCSFPAHCYAGMRGVMTVIAAE